jgi:hypothetical protein
VRTQEALRKVARRKNGSVGTEFSPEAGNEGFLTDIYETDQRSERTHCCARPPS